MPVLSRPRSAGGADEDERRREQERGSDESKQGKRARAHSSVLWVKARGFATRVHRATDDADMVKPKRSRIATAMKPKQERSRGTVDAILTAAARIFVRQGIQRATTNRIAKTAAVSVGSVCGE